MDFEDYKDTEEFKETHDLGLKMAKELEDEVNILVGRFKEISIKYAALGLNQDLVLGLGAFVMRQFYTTYEKTFGSHMDRIKRFELLHKDDIKKFNQS